MLVQPPFVKEAIEKAVEMFMDELDRLDYINKTFKDGVFLGRAKDLPPKVRSILLDSFSLRRKSH